MPTRDPSALEPLPAVADSIELVTRAQAGDRAALNHLFERYYERVYRIVRIRMGARLREVLDSLDLVQETCAVAARKLDDFRPRDHASLIQWLAKIAERQIHDAADRMRAQKRDSARQVPLAAGEASEDAFQLPAGGASPTSIVANQELREIYDGCVESLAGDYREVILLRDYAQASWEQLCEALGIPNVHAAQAKHRRAQIKLAGILRQKLGR